MHCTPIRVFRQCIKDLQSKTTAAFAGITLSIAGSVHAQDMRKTADETALLKLERDWMDAENRRDEKALGALLDDRFVATFGIGKSVNKQQYVKNLTHGTIDPTVRQDMVNENMVVDANTAVIVALNTISGTRNGTPYDIALRITFTFIKSNDQWTALALHGILIEKT